MHLTSHRSVSIEDWELRVIEDKTLRLLPMLPVEKHEGNLEGPSLLLARFSTTGLPLALEAVPVWRKASEIGTGAADSSYFDSS